MNEVAENIVVVSISAVGLVVTTDSVSCVLQGSVGTVTMSNSAVVIMSLKVVSVKNPVVTLSVSIEVILEVSVEILVEIKGVIGSMVAAVKVGTIFDEVVDEG